MRLDMALANTQHIVSVEVFARDWRFFCDFLKSFLIARSQNLSFLVLAFQKEHVRYGKF